MGYYGKLEEKTKAVELRKKGLSYKEILKKVPVSKSTLSLWCRQITLSVEQEERLLKRKLKGAELGRIRGAKNQQVARIKKTREIIEKAKKEVGTLTRREKFIAGVGLYLGDGSKGDDAVGFSNSNSGIIKFMMSWFREIVQIPEDKFRGAIWLHDNLCERDAISFWAGISQIPINQFHKTYIAKNKTESKKIRKNLHQYGVFTVRVSSRDTQRKIRGWMEGTLESC